MEMYFVKIGQIILKLQAILQKILISKSSKAGLKSLIKFASNPLSW